MKAKHGMNMKTKGRLVVKLTNAEDEATGTAVETFGFQKVRGRAGEVRLNRFDARKKEKVMEALVLQNIDLSPGDADVMKAVQKAIYSQPKSYVLNAKHVGWRDDRSAFVATARVIGVQPSDVNIEPPTWLTQAQRSLIGTAGDYSQWVKKVAQPARYSTRLMLIISAAFAAPLVSIVSMQNFGINLFGRSKVGKTAALLAATSLIGIGKESSLPNWNMTDASFQELARVFNDQIFGVNEVGLLAGRKADAYGDHMRSNIYRFAEGRDRSRHSSSGVGSSPGSSTWSGIFVSTAEHSFNVYASFSGEQRDEGETARCLDVPATAKGKPTIFDKWPEKIGKKGADAWARAKVVQLRRACESNHGVALEPYIRHLLANKATIRPLVEEWIEEFVNSVDVPAHNGALQHAAKNMGLIYAGGRAGIEAGCLPWSQIKLLAAIQKCFKAALRELRVYEDVDRKAQLILRAKLQGASVVPYADNLNSKRVDGFFKKKKGRIIYTIRCKAFKSWFSNPAHEKAAIQWLVDSKRLQEGAKRLVSKTDTVGATKKSTFQQPRWPDDLNPRAYVFTDPFGES